MNVHQPTGPVSDAQSYWDNKPSMKKQPRALRTSELGLVAYHHIERPITYCVNMECIRISEHGDA